MANTFKVITKAGVTSADVIYTVAGSTTTVILGLVLGNTTASQINATVTLSSDTSSRAGNNDEANQIIYTPYIVSLYETLFQYKKTQPLIPYLSTKQEILDNEQYLRTWCGNKKYKQVLQLFK